MGSVASIDGPVAQPVVRKLAKVCNLRHIQANPQKISVSPSTLHWATETGFEDDDRSQLPMANPRLLIALHSPNALLETGLRGCPPERSRDSDPVLSGAVRSLQFFSVRHHRFFYGGPKFLLTHNRSKRKHLLSANFSCFLIVFSLPEKRLCMVFAGFV
jgi:hypothetical protein